MPQVQVLSPRPKREDALLGILSFFVEVFGDDEAQKKQDSNPGHPNTNFDAATSNRHRFLRGGLSLLCQSTLNAQSPNQERNIGCNRQQRSCNTEFRLDQYIVYSVVNNGG